MKLDELFPSEKGEGKLFLPILYDTSIDATCGPSSKRVRLGPPLVTFSPGLPRESEVSVLSKKGAADILGEEGTIFVPPSPHCGTKKTARRPKKESRKRKEKCGEIEGGHFTSLRKWPVFRLFFDTRT